MKEKELKELIEFLAQKGGDFKEKNVEFIMSYLLSEMISHIMEKERDFHLEETNDQKNGYYNIMAVYLC